MPVWLVETLISLLLIAIVLLGFYSLFDTALLLKDKVLLFFGSSAFILSTSSFYLTVLRPRLMSPRLNWSRDIQRSDPTVEEIEIGAKRSWFIRLKVVNSGQNPAKNCVGRLIEVRNEKGKKLDRFDPLNLYWARQDRSESFNPIDIQGNGDLFFLDVAQVKEAENVLSLRVVIPERHRLILEPDLPQQPDFPPGTYFFRIAVYAEGTYIKPTWFMISWSTNYSTDPPCSIKKVERPPTEK